MKLTGGAQSSRQAVVTNAAKLCRRKNLNQLELTLNKRLAGTASPYLACGKVLGNARVAEPSRLCSFSGETPLPLSPQKLSRRVFAVAAARRVCLQRRVCAKVVSTNGAGTFLSPTRRGLETPRSVCFACPWNLLPAKSRTKTVSLRKTRK